MQYCLLMIKVVVRFRHEVLNSEGNGAYACRRRLTPDEASPVFPSLQLRCIEGQKKEKGAYPLCDEVGERVAARSAGGVSIRQYTELTISPR
nr:hypothetical protein [Mucilaginibacter sp. FT3.2]